ncbi:MAG: dienelactone hydrolase family protein [Cyclobacteriaceae bacterium]
MNLFLSVYSRVTGLTLLLLAISFLDAYAQQVAKRAPNGQGYLLHLPSDYAETNQDYPVLIFLHGIDEKGSGSSADLEKLKVNGPPSWIERGHDMQFTVNSRSYSYIVVSPQLSEEASGWYTNQIDKLISHIQETYRVDAGRIYLTGLSMGGNGTWRYGFDKKEEASRVAAIAPIAGWGNPAKVCNIADKKLPVWAFHGANDRVIAESRDRSMVKALKRCDSTLITYTVYENTGHDSWTRAYDPGHKYHSPNLYEWLLAHSLPGRETERNNIPNTLPIENANPDSQKVADKCTVTGEKKKRPKGIRFRMVSPMPKALHETSGLLVRGPNRIWSHNDSGNQPVLFLTDTLGNVLDMKTVTGAFNLDWEDLAEDDDGNVYIGDFGNNRNNRRALQIFKIPNPDLEEDNRISAEKIEFTYPDQTTYPPDSTRMNFDMEAMIYKDGALYLFSKNRTVPYTGISKIYKIPSEPGTYEASLIDSLSLGGNMMLETWVSAADISKDGRTVALLGYDKIFLLTCLENDDFSGASLETISLEAFSQKEGIGFINETELFISDEIRFGIIGGNLYRVDLSEYIDHCGR